MFEHSALAFVLGLADYIVSEAEMCLRAEECQDLDHWRTADFGTDLEVVLEEVLQVQAVNPCDAVEVEDLAEVESLADAIVAADLEKDMIGLAVLAIGSEAGMAFEASYHPVEHW